MPIFNGDFTQRQWCHQDFVRRAKTKKINYKNKEKNTMKFR